MSEVLPRVIPDINLSLRRIIALYVLTGICTGVRRFIVENIISRLKYQLLNRISKSKLDRKDTQASRLGS
jgi:hypothetical protein